jgi:hypothetical protein
MDGEARNLDNPDTDARMALERFVVENDDLLIHESRVGTLGRPERRLQNVASVLTGELLRLNARATREPSIREFPGAPGDRLFNVINSRPSCLM